MSDETNHQSKPLNAEDWHTMHQRLSRVAQPQEPASVPRCSTCGHVHYFEADEAGFDTAETIPWGKCRTCSCAQPTYISTREADAAPAQEPRISWQRCPHCQGTGEVGNFPCGFCDYHGDRPKQPDSIEWTDVTWNPVRGCALVSEGCRNCYAMKVAHRFAGKGGPYEGLTELGPSGPRWTGQVRTVGDALLEPIRWKRPQRVFVNSMSDLFHEDVPDSFIDQVFAVMALASRHTFQILTKRPARMRAYFEGDRRARVEAAGAAMKPNGPPRHWYHVSDWSMRLTPWPLRNVWLGVSCENQKAADERIPLLLQTPAEVRFVSAEPLLGPIDLGLTSATCTCCERIFSSRWVRVLRPLTCGFPLALLEKNRDRIAQPGIYRASSNKHGALAVETPAGDIGVKPDEVEVLPSLDWVIVGGESGPGARPCAVEWIERIVDQCRAGGVAPFVKQLGAYCVSETRTAPVELMSGPPAAYRDHIAPNGEVWAWRAGLTDAKGGELAQGLDDRYCVREFPTVHPVSA